MKVSHLRLPLLLVALAAVPSVRAQVNYESHREFTVWAKSGNTGVTTLENSGAAVKVSFDFDNDAGWLRVTLQNISRAGSASSLYGYGVLTGFGFDTPSNVKLVPGTSKIGNYYVQDGPGSDNSYSLFTGTPFATYDMSSSQLPTFDYGIGVQTGGGSPNNGLNAGSTIYLNFQFQQKTGGLPLANFNAVDWFKNNGSDADVGFRFQRTLASGSGSDKVAFVVPDFLAPIPEPSTYGAAALAGLVLVIVARKRRRSGKI